MGSEESTREDVGCGGNRDGGMDVWRHKAGHKKERKWEEYPRKCTEIGVVRTWNEKNRGMCGQKNDGDGCASEEKEWLIEADMDGQHQNDLKRVYRIWCGVNTLGDTSAFVNPTVLILLTRWRKIRMDGVA